MSKSGAIIDYPEAYIEACFYAWYRADRPNLSAPSKKLLDALPSSPDGRKPHRFTVRAWRDKYGWEQRADDLDAQASVKLDKEVVDERVKVLRQLARDGEEVKNKGLEYFRNTENPFADNPSAAVRAVMVGMEAQFKYSGAADRLILVSQMTDKQLEREILRHLGKNENEIIDAQSEDISENDDSTEDNES